MSPRTRWTALGVAIALPLVGALGAWWFSTHERVEEEVELPRVGEITYNPLYVLGLSLREAGWTVDMRQRLDRGEVALGRHDTVLVFNDPRRLSDADSQALLDFAAAGGHLIVRTPPPEAVTVDTRVALFEPLGVTPRGPSACIPLQVSGESEHVEFCEGRNFDIDVRPRVVWEPGAGEGDPADAAGDTEVSRRARDVRAPEARGKSLAKPAGAGPADANADARSDEAMARFRARQRAQEARLGIGRYVYARLPHGQGSVDVIADLDFLTNDKLHDAPHVALTRQLFEPNHQAGAVHLLYAAEMPSLWRWLFTHSWMAWLPLALGLLAWLWSRMQRFGPLLPSPPAERRSLLEHVRASGELAWRYGYAHVLHDAVRTAFLARLRRRDPQAAALEGDVQAALIAERFHITPVEVREALATPSVRDPAAFRARIATLIRLRNQL